MFKKLRKTRERDVDIPASPDPVTSDLPGHISPLAGGLVVNTLKHLQLSVAARVKKVTEDHLKTLFIKSTVGSTNKRRRNISLSLNKAEITSLVQMIQT